MSFGDETPSSGHHRGCTNSLRTLRHPATLRACPRRGAAPSPGYAPRRDKTRASLLLWAPYKAEPSVGRPRTAPAVPSPGWGKQHCPERPLPSPGASSPGGATSQQQGWEKNQVFFISQISLPCFKAERYLGLISCNIVLGEIHHHMLG